ncbi:hypothetical protein STXM2123_590 [Streptomyces sp. F-3]|nr:hypothetical protein STXM2123_590 [Streptomyces sp. F-3]
MWPGSRDAWPREGSCGPLSREAPPKSWSPSPKGAREAEGTRGTWPWEGPGEGAACDGRRGAGSWRGSAGRPFCEDGGPMREGSSARVPRGTESRGAPGRAGSGAGAAGAPPDRPPASGPSAVGHASPSGPQSAAGRRSPAPDRPRCGRWTRAAGSARAAGAATPVMSPVRTTAGRTRAVVRRMNGNSSDRRRTARGACPSRPSQPSPREAARGGAPFAGHASPVG